MGTNSYCAQLLSCVFTVFTPPPLPLSPVVNQVSAGDTTLSLLPPWHIYQRSAAYYLFSRYSGGA
jgi:hypothetical protein